MTTKVKLQSRWAVCKARSLAFCLIASCALSTGCSTDFSGSDSKASYWEQLWLDGTDALSEGRLVDARRSLELAVVEARSTRRGDMRVGVTLDRLGDTYVQSQMADDAEQKYKEAIDAFDRSLKQDKSEANQRIVLKEQIGTFNSLAAIWLQQNKFTKAEKILDQAVANAKLLGLNDLTNTRDKLVLTEYGSCLQKLVLVYENTQRKDKAEKTYVRASKFMPDLVVKDGSSSLLRSAVGEKDPETGMSANQSARLNEMIRKWNPIYQAGLRAQKEADFVGAQLYFRKAYQIARAYNDSCEPTVDSLTQLLRMTNKLHQFPEAERLYNENQALFMKATPTKSIDNALGEVTKTFTRRARWSETEKILVRRVKVREFLRGPTNVHVAETLADLGSVYIEMKHMKQAELVLQKALKITDATDQQDSELASKIALRLSTLKQDEK